MKLDTIFDVKPQGRIYYVWLPIPPPGINATYACGKPRGSNSCRFYKESTVKAWQSKAEQVIREEVDNFPQDIWVKVDLAVVGCAHDLDAFTKTLFDSLADALFDDDDDSRILTGVQTKVFSNSYRGVLVRLSECADFDLPPDLRAFLSEHATASFERWNALVAVEKKKRRKFKSAKKSKHQMRLF